MAEGDTSPNIDTNAVDWLTQLDPMALGGLAGCTVAEPMWSAATKIARYCALVAVGAIEMPSRR